MVRRSTTNRRRNNRNRPRRNSRRRPNTSSVVRVSSSALRGIETTRSLTFAPSTIDASTGVVTSSWLEKALPYAAIMMKFVGTLITSPSPKYTGTVAISSIVQSVLIGIEDIIYDHPITSPKNVTIDKKEYETMTIDYSIGKLHHLKVVVSMMGEVSKRAGRLAAVLQPLTRDKAFQLRDQIGYTAEVKTFQQLTQMPGAVVSPNLRPIVFVRVPTGFPASKVDIGQAESRSYIDDKLVYPQGGLPLYQLIVGYQDLATISADPKLAYDAVEATLCVELCGRVSLEAPVSKARTMRSLVKKLYSNSNVTCFRPGSREPVHIPLSSLERVSNGFYGVVEPFEEGFERMEIPT